MAGMRVAVIDVGANTLRLLVAERTVAGLNVIHRARVQLDLGQFVEERGSIPLDRLHTAKRAANTHASSARRLACPHIEDVITSPGTPAAHADAPGDRPP